MAINNKRRTGNPAAQRRVVSEASTLPYLEMMGLAVRTAKKFSVAHLFYTYVHLYSASSADFRFDSSYVNLRPFGSSEHGRSGGR
jgi:hypothetical protein